MPLITGPLHAPSNAYLEKYIDIKLDGSTTMFKND